jgi:hypothetical protein
VSDHHNLSRNRSPSSRAQVILVRSTKFCIKIGGTHLRGGRRGGGQLRKLLWTTAVYLPPSNRAYPAPTYVQASGGEAREQKHRRPSSLAALVCCICTYVCCLCLVFFLDRAREMDCRRVDENGLFKESERGWCSLSRQGGSWWSGLICACR